MRLPQKKFHLGGIAFILLLAQPLAALAKTDTADPNAATRKQLGPPTVPTVPKGPPEIPGIKALADLEAAQKRNNEMAILHFTQLIQANPKDSAAYAGRGKAYSGLKDYDKAGADFNKAIEIDPKQIEAYKGRAVLKYVKQDIDGSWEDVHKVEALGGAMWPSFMEALKSSASRKSQTTNKKE